MTCRIMMIILLVLAFAHPYKPVGFTQNKVSGSVACIYIDNSFSMDAEGPEGIGLESAKQKAMSIVNASQPDTKFALLTNDLSEKHYRFYSRQEMINLIGEINHSYHQTSLSTIILRFNNLTSNLLNQSGKRIYVISDFQKKSSDLMNLKPDTLTAYNFLPVPINKSSNIYIDTCWFDTPAHHQNQLETINVRIINQSEKENFNIPVNLYINDSLKALASVNLQPNEKKTVSMQYINKNEGIQSGKIELNDYPITYDNAIYFSYMVSGINKSLLIKSGQHTSDTHNFEALFLNDAHISLDIITDERIQISNLKNYSSIFLFEMENISSGLAEELSKYVKNGGHLVIIPAISCNIADYNSLLTMFQSAPFSTIDTVAVPIAGVSYQNQLFAGVFKENDNKVQLPTIKKRYRFATIQNIAEVPLMTFADKSNALTIKNDGKGKLYTFAFPFSEKNNHFVDHLLFLPTIYNIALFASSNPQLYSILGKDKFLYCNNPLETVFQNPVLSNRVNRKEYVPANVKQEGNLIQMSIDENMDAGLYYVNVGKEQIGGVALNYDLNESDLTCYTPDDIQTLVGQSGIKHYNLIREKNSNLSSAIQELDKGKQYWKLFIIIAIFFIFLEAAIIRLWDIVVK